MRDQSIHPRVIAGRTVHKKSNTCVPAADPYRGKLKKRVLNLERRRHARDIGISEVKQRNTAFPWEAAFRIPGSMKGY